MSSIRKLSSSRFLRRRLEIETLERRECPAVMFALEGGVLSITGDEEPNNIAIFQPRDRVVEVVGDGARRTFQNVDEILVDAQGGHDAIHTGKPKDIVVVGSKIKINAGAGNDRIRIDDGGPSRTPVIFNTPLNVAIDLGTGADEVNFQVHHHDDVDLNLTSTDGDDRVAIGMLLPAIQKVRDAAAHSSLDLGEGGNVVVVRTENVDDVALSIAATPSGSTVRPPNADGDNISVALHRLSDPTLRRGNWVLDVTLGDNDDIVAVDASELDAHHPDFAWNPSRITRLNSTIDLGAGNDRLTIDSAGPNEIDTFIDAGAGDDVVRGVASRACAACRYKTSSSVNLGEGDDQFVGETRGFDDVYTSIDAGAGNDTVDARDYVVWQKYLGNSPSQIQHDVHLGAGNDRLNIDAVDYAQVNTFIDAGQGHDRVRYKMLFAPLVEPLDGARLKVFAELGAGNDRLEIDAAGYADADINIDAGAGDDRVSGKMILWVRDSSPSQLAFFASLGAGSDSLDLDTFGYRQIRTAIHTGPAGDGRDRVVASHQASRRTGPVQVRRLALDGGRDVFEQRTLGYSVQVGTVGIVALEYLLLG